MAKQAGDILISIGSELNPSFTKTMSQARGSLGKLYSIVANGAKEFASTSHEIHQLQQRYDKLSASISKGSKGNILYENRQKKLKSSIEATANKLEEARKNSAKLNEELASRSGAGNLDPKKIEKYKEAYDKLIAAREVLARNEEAAEAHPRSKKIAEALALSKQDVAKYQRSVSRYENQGYTQEAIKALEAEDKELEKLRIKAKKAADEVERLERSLAGKKSDYKTNEQVRNLDLEAAKADLNDYLVRIGELEHRQDEIKEGIVYNVGNTIFDGANKAAKKLLNTLVKLGKVALKTIGKLSGVYSDAASNAISLSKAVRLIVQYGFGFRSLYYLVRRFRTGIKEGFEYLGRYAEEVQEQIDKLSEAFYFLKSAAAAALQPILNVLMPALQKLVALFSAAITAIANFIATLTGQSYIYKASTNLDDYANALDKAAGSAKELKNQLAGFDEMNVLTSPSSGGSGSSEIDTSNWFEKLEVEPSKLAKMIQDAIHRADFTDVGKELSRKLVLMLETIDWDDIFNKVNKVANSFASFLNGLLSPANLGKDIGTFVANIFNSISGFISEAVKKFDWNRLSVQLANMINSFFDNFNATQYGDAISKFIKNIIDTAAKVIRKTNTKKIGKAIGDFIKALNIKDLIKSLTAFVGELFDAVCDIIKTSGASKIVTALIAGFAVVKGAGLANTLISFFTAGKSNLGTVIVSKLLPSISTALKSMVPNWLSSTITVFGPQIAAAAGALGLIFVGALGIDAYIKKQNSEVAEALQESRDTIESIAYSLTNYADIQERIASTSDETINNAMAEAQVIEVLSKKLFDCYDNTGKLKKGTEELAKAYFDELKAKGLFPAYSSFVEFNKALDTQQTTIQELTGDIKTYTDELIKSAKIEAVTQALKDTIQGEIEAQMEYEKLLDLQSRAADINIKELERLEDTARDLNYMGSSTAWLIADFFDGDILTDFTNGVDATTKKLDSMINTLKSSQPLADLYCGGDAASQIQMLERVKETIAGMTDEELASLLTLDESLEKGGKGLTDYSSKVEYYSNLVGQYYNELYGSISEANQGIATSSEETANVLEASEAKMQIAFEELGGDISTLSTDSETRMGEMATFIEGRLKDIANTAETTSEEMSNSMSKNTADMANTSAKNTAAAGEAISENLAVGGEGMNNSTVDTFNTMVDNANTGMNRYNDAIYNGMQSAVKTYTNGCNKIISNYSEMQQKTGQGWGASANLNSSFSKAPVNTVSANLTKKSFGSGILGSLKSMLHLANGAVIPPNKEFLAVLGDQKSGTNIEAPLDTIVSAMKQALSDQNFGGDINVNLQVDGKTLAKTVVKYNDKLSFNTNRG